MYVNVACIIGMHATTNRCARNEPSGMNQKYSFSVNFLDWAYRLGGLKGLCTLFLTVWLPSCHHTCMSVKPGHARSWKLGGEKRAILTFFFFLSWHILFRTLQCCKKKNVVWRAFFFFFWMTWASSNEVDIVFALGAFAFLLCWHGGANALRA